MAKCEWQQVERNKGRCIDEWKSSVQRKRNEFIILTRLRLGHTKLTHQYLMERRNQPYCDDYILPLSVKHIIAECPYYSDSRNRIFHNGHKQSDSTIMKNLGKFSLSKPTALIMEKVYSIS